MVTLTVLLTLVAFSGLFSGSEAALFSLNRAQIRNLEGREDRLSALARSLLGQQQKLLNSLLVGNTLMNIGISAVVTSYAIARYGEHGVEWAILVATGGILLFGEILPKTIAVNFPLLTSRVLALPLTVVLPVLRPLTLVATGLSVGLLRLLGQEAAAGGIERRVTEAELRAVLEEIDEEAGMSKLESRLVRNIKYFPRTTAEEIMTPRVDIVGAPVRAGSTDLLALIRSSKHSRIPLYQTTLDTIAGYLPAKEFLLDPTTPVAKLIRPVLIVPEKAPINRVFHDFRKGHWRMAVVVNEYGETVGLLTQEDLIEEVVGEISDEFERADEEIVATGEESFEVRGRASLQDLAEALNAPLPLEQAVTVNGFLCALHGGFPRPGTVLRWGDWEFEVLEASRHRIQRARVRRAPDEGAA